MIRLLLTRLTALAARLEPRHWVAVVGSAALHLGVLLGLSQAQPEPLPLPLTFEVKLEPPPAATPVKQPKQRVAKAKAKVAKAKKLLAKKKTDKKAPQEPHVLQAEWKAESKPARDTPALNLPDARALGIETEKPLAAASAASPAKAAASRPASGGEAAASGGAGKPGVALAAATGQGKTQALAAASGAGAQGSDALAGSAAASGNLATTSLSASAAAGSSLNRAASGGGMSVQASEFSSRSPGAMSSGEPNGIRLALAGVLTNLAALPAGNGSLGGGQLNGAVGANAASAGNGSQANLATAASSGQPAVVSAAGPTRAGSGSEISAASEHGAAASGSAPKSNLASAASGNAGSAAKPGTPAGGGSDGGNSSVGESSAAVSAPQASHAALASSGSGGGSREGKAPSAHKARAGLGESGDKAALASAGNAPEGTRLARSKQAGSPATGKEPGASEGGKGGKHGHLAGDPSAAAAAAAGEQPQGRGAATALSGSGKNEGRGQALAGAQAGPGGADASSGNGRGLGDSGHAGASGRLASATGAGAIMPRQPLSGAGLSGSRATPATLVLGEPGSSPRLAMAMPVVPAVLDTRPGGARSSSRAATGQGGGGAPQRPGKATLVEIGGADASPLPGRGAGSAALSATAHQAGGVSGGGDPAGNGRLQGIKVAAVEQIRPDSQVQVLDVLAPSTFCPLPGHVQPDNRPRAIDQDVTEKPAYASENPSFAFPIRAWAYGHEGRVTVRVQVLADGTPGLMWLKQSSGSGILDVDAREQLAKYHFKPARKNGQPVTAWIDVPVDYRLNAESKP